MLIVKLLAISVFAFVIFKTVQKLSGIIRRDHHGYQAFTKKYFIAITGGYFFMVCGALWHQHSVEVGGDTTNSVALAFLGVAMIGSVVYQHIRATSVAVGLGISAVQLPLFAVLAYFGSALLVLGGLLFLAVPAATRQSRYVRVID